MGAVGGQREKTPALDETATADSQGNRRLLGGKRVRQDTGGFYVEPTIFDRLEPDHTLAREEVFGPVLGVQTFRDFDQAIALANDTVYGLAAGLWTNDINRALSGARQLKAGLVWINGWDACDITMPFGGFKQSGFGRDRSLHALHKYADLKSVSVTLR